MKKIVAIITVVFVVCNLYSQSDIDAFRFSQTNWEGTAKFMGAGGALGAVGADFSALSINPASIGLYKRNEIELSPLGLSVINSITNYNDKNTEGRRLSYSFPNAGIVLALPCKKENSNLKTVQFGFGYNRIKDFNNKFIISGNNFGSSYSDALIANASGLPGSLNRDSYGAWYTYIIDYDTLNDRYYSPLTNAPLNQHQTTTTKGGIDEMLFSIGTNYNDKFYFGATIGIPFISYNETTIFEETNDNPGLGWLSSYKITDSLKVKGTGINLKLGFIYQPVYFLRIGLAIHTPTYYGTVKDNFGRSFNSKYIIGTGERWNYRNNFRYSLYTPFVAVGSVAFLIQKRAFVSAEYEITDYSLAFLDSKNYSFEQENNDISQKYGIAHSVRIGGECFVTPNFILRAGYGFKSSPYSKDVNFSLLHQISGGIGFRIDSFSLDLAYVYRTSTEKYWMYDPVLVNASINHYKSHKVVFTISKKF